MPDNLRFSVRTGPFVLERNLAELGTVKVADFPKSVSISPDQTTAYVCNLEHGSVDIVRTSDGRPLKRLVFRRTPTRAFFNGAMNDSFEEKPVEVAFSRGGRVVWISLLNAGGVVVYDARGGQPPAGVDSRVVDLYDHATGASRPHRVRFIPTGRQPKIIAVSPDGRYAFVANWQGKSVTVIDAARYGPVATVPVGLLPRGICFVGGSAYVANFGSHTISEIDLATMKRVRNLRDVGRNPRHLVAAGDGKTFYASGHGDGLIRHIDAASGATLRSCAVGTEPRSISLSGRKNFLFVTNYQDDTLTAVDLYHMTPALTIATLRRPIGVSVDRRTDTVWVTGYWDRAVRRYRFESRTRRPGESTASALSYGMARSLPRK